jgi:hypothetical protein
MRVEKFFKPLSDVIGRKNRVSAPGPFGAKTGGSASVYYAPKLGNSDEDYEDAYGYDCEGLCFCVADGATESIFSKKLADALVSAFISVGVQRKGSLRIDMAKIIRKAQTRWRRSLSRMSLPWYAEEKARDGAHAAFIGVRISPGRETGEEKINRVQRAPRAMPLRWEAVAVGDSCVFVVDNDSLAGSFPIENSADFCNTPNLISSIRLVRHDDISYVGGRLTGSEKIYLASDAVSQWFLKVCESGEKPWKILDRLKSVEDFNALIAKLRGDGEMKNDDATIISVGIERGLAA